MPSRVCANRRRNRKIADDQCEMDERPEWKARTPLGWVESSLEGLELLVHDWDEEAPPDEAEASHFHELRSILTARIGHLAFARDLMKQLYEFEFSTRPARRMTSERREAFRIAIWSCNSALARLKPQSPPSQVAHLDSGYVSQLQLLRRTCEHLIADPSSDAIGPDYDRYRDRLVSTNRYFMPITVTTCLTFREFRRAVKRVEKSGHDRAAFVSNEFDEIQAILARSGPPDADEARHHASDWTGRRTVTDQVRMIRAFAPTVMDGLSELIDLHERLGGNLLPTQTQLDALSLLKQLHADVGDLLIAVEAGKPHGILAERVKAVGRRLFSLKSDTRELLVLGLPTVAASVVTLGVIKGLEYIAGFDLGETETAAIVTAAGGSFVVHSTKKVGQAHPGRRDAQPWQAE